MLVIIATRTVHFLCTSPYVWLMIMLVFKEKKAKKKIWADFLDVDDNIMFCLCAV